MGNFRAPLPLSAAVAAGAGACALGFFLTGIAAPAVAWAGPGDSDHSGSAQTDAGKPGTRPGPRARAAASQTRIAGPAAVAPRAAAQAAPPAAAVGARLAQARRSSNQGPTAAPVQAMIRPNGQVWGFVAASDPEGDPITYAVKKGPRFGTVSVDPNGAYHYTPGAGFSGTDTFRVTVKDLGAGAALRHRRNIKITVSTAAGNPTGTVTDNFSGAAGSAPDPALWGYHLGPWRDDGLQTYTDSPDNVRMDGLGHLLIQAQTTPDGYTSTRLVTQDRLTMQYGVIEASIKMPAGQGIWPAFWTLGTSYYPDNPSGWPSCGEIDIMELVNTGTRYNVALHGPQGDTDYYGGVDSGQFVGRQGPISSVAPISDLTAGYHDYWMMWREDQIVIGVDNTMLGDFTPASLPEGAQWVFNEPMYAILQIAVGGPWPGPPDQTTPWPATMAVDSFTYTPLA